jgi:hypothetical protein
MHLLNFDLDEQSVIDEITAALFRVFQRLNAPAFLGRPG